MSPKVKSGAPNLCTAGPARKSGEGLRLEEEFDCDGDVGGDWLSAACGRFVAILLECGHGGAL
jgi:hypothetical protein